MSLRWFRGLVGVTWGVAWGAIFWLISLIIGFVDPGSIDPGEEPIRIAGMGAFFGLVSGAAFGVLLSVNERRKGILELSMTRAIVWGILGTALFPLVAKKAALPATPEQPKLP